MRLFELLNEADYDWQPSWLPTAMARRIAKYNPGQEREVVGAIENVASTKGFSPAALAGVIDTESKFNPRAKGTGSFRGGLQMGKAVFNDNGGVLGGLTHSEYAKADLPTQINHYTNYLDNYNFDKKMAGLGEMDPATQAAALQGFQFAPNSVKTWQRPFFNGDTSMPTTPYPQASKLGSTSIDDMKEYYSNILGTDNTSTSTQIATATPPKSSSPTSSLRPNARPNASGTSTQIATATPPKSTLSTKGSVQTATPLPIRDMKPINYDKLSNVGTTNYNIRRGASGDNVRQLQTKLSNMGYNIGTSGADGKFGKNTAAAVRQFQKDYNLQVDGIVGDQTMSALSQIRSTPIKPQVGGTGATAMGNIGDSTRGTNLDARDAANMAVASTPKNISYGDTMGVTTKPSKPAPVTTKLPPVPPRTNIT